MHYFDEFQQQDFERRLLVAFTRYQETTQVYFSPSLGAAKLELRADSWVDDWDAQAKEARQSELYQAHLAASVLIGCWDAERNLHGFSLVHSREWGPYTWGSKAYAGEIEGLCYHELLYFHISQEYRNRGLGKQLWYVTMEHAQKKGWNNIYIGAHPSVESIGFYLSRGSTLAPAYIEEIYQKEPRDIQLVYHVAKAL